jgi:hypothetical protein
VSLSRSALEAALPAATIAAVASVANGLTNASTQVYVASRPRVSPVSPQAWWRPIDPALLDGGLGVSRHALRYWLVIDANAPTLAQLQDWARALVDYFHGWQRPALATLYRALVSEPEVELYDGEGPAGACRVVVSFEPR